MGYFTYLNGGTWNPGETLCTTLDLSNLPNGGSIILGIVSATGHLDVGVQDDSAVDYLILSAEYENANNVCPSNILLVVCILKTVLLILGI